MERKVTLNKSQLTFNSVWEGLSDDLNILFYYYYSFFIACYKIILKFIPS